MIRAFSRYRVTEEIRAPDLQITNQLFYQLSYDGLKAIKFICIQLADLIKSLEEYYNIGLSPIIFNPDAAGSDHSSFWNQGYTAVLLIEANYGSDDSTFYLTANDRIFHFNLDYFHAQLKLAVATIALLAFYNITPVGLEDNEDTFLSGFELKQN